MATTETGAGRRAFREPTSGPVIVVGVDGSAPSSKALLFAAEEARLRGGSLRVVEAWSFPTFAADTYVPGDAYEDLLEGTSQALRAQVDEVLTSAPGVTVERVVEEGPAAQVILDSAKDADLVVVGSRGRGGFAGLLLGSVSTQVVHHAHCPVAVVRS